MAKSELRNRANWQTISGFRALKTEKKFRSSLQEALNSAFPDQFKVEKAKDFKDIYSTYILPDDVLEKIYNVDVVDSSGNPKYSWGIDMDFAIRNTKNKKTLFGEIKRQDGWVETTSSTAGRGNAHERSCKYFTPGLLKVIRDKSGISDDILPFWIIFVGDITRDPRRNREIAFWFQEYKHNFYMWRDTENISDMLDFFENNLLPYLL
ncbi:MAG: MunI family type II restriction endonuclease [Holophagales bacterium]|jgi:hypothetical protein|nr:MunI family type II restriction endonuclease [Holophagales bacterium]